ncbi:MAG: hypothetical protein ACE5E6_10415 [Phycisphaerae bacterium]
MNNRRVGKYAGVVAVIGLVQAAPVSAQQHWVARDGVVTLTLSIDALERTGLIVLNPEVVASSSDGTITIALAIEPAWSLGFDVRGQRAPEVPTAYLPMLDALDVVGAGVVHPVTALVIRRDAPPCGATPAPGEAPTLAATTGLELAGVKAVLDPVRRRLSLATRDVIVTRGLADMLGRPELAGETLGRAVVSAAAVWAGGDAPPDTADVMPLGDGGDVAGGAPDMVFCQLYGLAQYGRLGNIVGLSLATTSWNIGTAPLPWHAIPNEDHPFIVWDLYRMKTVDGSTRFEQVGQSWIKHGFCALDSSQCTTSCQPTGCSTLGLGCTDTYSSGLNAGQGGLGPRYEVNPWTRAWTYAGSHLSQGGHSHNPIEHRLQVRDADLDPAQNPGATYYADGYYVAPEDINQMNSAAWKQVGVSGTPGGVWSFSMSPPGTMAEVGFPIDAWTGATKTVLAQEVPVVEFASPDGRCILAAEATDLGGGTWHYEYALLNVDMDRKVASFSIPIDVDTVVTNTGFHAVASHDEPYSNAPWSVTVGNGAVTWSTTANPLRWGTMYNFRFDADAPPVTDTTVTLGLYEPGSPEVVVGTTTGPPPSPPDCNNNDILDDCDLACGEPGGACDVPGCGNSEDCDGNGVPDECSSDIDGDGVIDACDDDMDGDGVGNDQDVCPDVPVGLPAMSDGRPMGDFDADCDVTLADYRLFSICIHGPEIPVSTFCAEVDDFDADADVDLRDFQVFQRAFGIGQ